MRVEFSPAANRDLQRIFRHLLDTHLAFGRPTREARDLAAGRVRAIRHAADRIAKAPQIGTLHPEIGNGIRHVTLDRAIFWFISPRPEHPVRIIAVYFTGQDHVARVMRRLGREGFGAD